MDAPRRFVGSGSDFEAELAYSRAVVDGDWVFVSGTSGFDYATGTIAEDVVAQAEQCFQNIEAALAEAGATLGDVVRVRYVVPHRADVARCAPVLRRRLGSVRPAATMLCADLIDPQMRIEIEVTARKRAD
jgi:enamine deaminase RidA (YjgF/YER057c/UK114 family)